MKYNDAVKLHAGDEVTLKENGVTLTVLWTEKSLWGGKEVAIHCEDGWTYSHREVR